MAKTLKSKLPKKSKLPALSENQIHSQIAQLLARALPVKVMWWHTPNGEARTAATGAKLKRMGVKPGVPDFLLYDRATGFLHCIEVKADSGYLSDAQKGWMDLFTSSPTGRYAVARSMGEALNILHDWWPKDVRAGPVYLISKAEELITDGDTGADT